MCRDCEYGDYKYLTAEKPHWTDDFRLLPKDAAYIKESYWSFLMDAANVCGLNTSEWGMRDWWDFEERISDCR